LAGVVAIIPARGGSKRVPGKNLLPLAGVPLVAHTIRHARGATTVDAIYVSTEDDAIAAVARDEGATVMPRSQELAGDEVSSEAVLLDVLDQRNAAGLDDPEVVVFLQATSPVRGRTDIDDAVAALRAAAADSLFSACREASHVWGEGGSGLESLTYDWHDRQREQEMGQLYRENGSIYVFRTRVLRETGNRLGGRIIVFPMDYWSSFQLDEPEHVDILEWILDNRA